MKSASNGGLILLFLTILAKALTPSTLQCNYIHFFLGGGGAMKRGLGYVRYVQGKKPIVPCMYYVHRYIVGSRGASQLEGTF